MAADPTCRVCGRSDLPLSKNVLTGTWVHGTCENKERTDGR